MSHHPTINCDEPPWEHLDPGIVNAVKLFNELGYTTCDSGDGVSKGKGDHITPFPHVTLLVDPAALAEVCASVIRDLEDHGFDMKQVDVQGIIPAAACPGEAFVCVGGEPLKGIVV